MDLLFEFIAVSHTKVRHGKKRMRKKRFGIKRRKKRASRAVYELRWIYNLHGVCVVGCACSTCSFSTSTCSVLTAHTPRALPYTIFFCVVVVNSTIRYYYISLCVRLRLYSGGGRSVQSRVLPHFGRIFILHIDTESDSNYHYYLLACQSYLYHALFLHLSKKIVKKVCVGTRGTYPRKRNHDNRSL